MWVIIIEGKTVAKGILWADVLDSLQGYYADPLGLIPFGAEDPREDMGIYGQGGRRVGVALKVSQI